MTDQNDLEEALGGTAPATAAVTDDLLRRVLAVPHYCLDDEDRRTTVADMLSEKFLAECRRALGDA